MQKLSALLISLGIVLCFTGCSVKLSAGVNIKSTPAQDSTAINWFVDKDGKPMPKGYVNWEAEKEQHHIPTDTIILHHTAAAPGMTWQELSNLEYTRLYFPRYQSNDPDPMVQGLTPHSGHYRTVDGKKTEVFYAYHWLIRPDGTTVRLLNDDEVGWNSGDWDTNMRSIAICFDGNFTDGTPTKAALASCAKLIAYYRKKYHITQVLGHKDVYNTECPGSWWPAGKAALLKEAGMQ